MYKLILYGHLVYCNIDILSLLRIPYIINKIPKEVKSIWISVSLNYDTHSKTETHMFERVNDYKYVFHIPGVIKYIIDADTNEINVITTDVSHFLDTFLNVPFSLLFLLQDKLVLHSCALVNRDDSIMAFSGIKGSGKSTLLTYFMTKGFGFFSDDTLLIDSVLTGKCEISCYGALNITKIDKEKVENSKKYYINSANKVYFPVQSKSTRMLSSGNLKDLFILGFRNNQSNFKSSTVENIMVKRLMICNAVSGFRLFNDELQDRVKKLKVLNSLAHLLRVRLITLKTGLEFMEHNFTQIVNLSDKFR